jgi:Winged helix-turn-helix DNA-binding
MSARKVHNMPKRPYPRYQRRHNAILLAVLENPAQKQKDIAKATGYSESQVSRILCSPDFLEIYDLALLETAREVRSKWLTRASARG